MRMLLPEARDGLSDADLDGAYAWPAAGPWLRVNMVSTVDGAARAPDGLSQGISSQVDRRVFGRMRGLADAVLAGAGTVRQEGYRPARPKPDFVEQRRAAGQPAVPVMVIVTRTAALDPTAPLLADALVRPVVLTCDRATPDARERLASVADVVVAGDDEVDLVAGLAALRARGLARINAEGGPHLLADMVAAGVVDELLLTVSPLLAGGAYADGTDVVRILAGAPLPEAPLPLRLAHLLEDDGTLFLRYLLR